MFKKTRIRLTLVNASVMFVIMSIFGASMYLFLEKQILGKFDQFLTESAVVYQKRTIAPRVSMLIQRPADRFIHVLQWDENNRIINSFYSEEYTDSLLVKLRDSLNHSGPYTIGEGNVKYRVLNVADPVADPIILLPRQQVRTAASLQLIINVTAEMNMLNMLLYMIIVGIFIGAILSVLAGLYLADKALIPIQSSWNKQQQFVADASHELRTPLAVMQSHTELLLRHPDHTIEQDSREISTILKEVHRMKKLVTGLLTLARTDSGQLELSKKPIRIDQLLDQVIQQMRPLAALKEIEIKQNIESRLVINGDEERLHQLLMILLDNAIKYTTEGGEILIVCKRHHNHILVSIADTGIGIPKEDIPHIFDRFYRGDKIRSRTDGGTGLGLSIAKWIVIQHGGKIRVDSLVESGTTFHIQLPM